MFYKYCNATFFNTGHIFIYMYVCDNVAQNTDILLYLSITVKNIMSSNFFITIKILVKLEKLTQNHGRHVLCHVKMLNLHD